MQKEAVKEELEEAILQREKAQFDKMTNWPIPKLIVSLGIPTMLNMMVTSLYNLADTYFVSGLSQEATGAVNVVLSLMSIIQAIGFMLGMGSGSIVSKLLGQRKQKEADAVASSTFVAALILGGLITVFGSIFLTRLLWVLGATEEVGVPVTTMEYARQYTRYILFAAPFMCASLVLNNVLRAQGKALLSMLGLVSGAVINVVLDPILIYTANMQMRGAALATYISQIISFLILLYLFLSGKTIVRVKMKSVSAKFAVYFDVVSTGFPSFCRQILASLCTVLLNWAVKPYDGALAALGVVQKVFMFAFSISLGIGQGYQPVLGYNHGCGRYDRVKKAYLFTLAFSTVLMVFFASACAIFAPNIMRAFLENGNAVEIGVLALRMQCLSMPLLPLNFMASVSYQVVGSKIAAAVLSVSRQGLFYIPAVLVLPRLFFLFGVQCCQAVSDVGSALFALPFMFAFLKSLNKENGEMPQDGLSQTQTVIFDE